MDELISTLAFRGKPCVLLETLAVDRSGKVGDLDRVGFLNLGSCDTLDQRILCCG